MLAHAHACKDGWKESSDEPWHHPESPLVLEVLRWAWHCKPRWIACEQVPQVLPFWRACRPALEAWGYKTWAGILNAADYGVAQTRRRAILMASLDRQPHAPAPTHCDGRPGDSLLGLAPWVTMAEALGWGLEEEPTGALLSVGGGLTDSTAAAEHAGSTNGRKRRGSGVIVSDGRTSNDRFQRSPDFAADQPSRVVTSKTRSWTVRTGRDSKTGGGLVRYARDVNRPAPTLDTKVNRWEVLPGWPLERPATKIAGDPRVHPPGHKMNASDPPDRYEGRSGKNAIKVTIEEAAILQGFRPDYPFQGSTTKKFEQVGNAVPPPLAAAVLGMLIGSERTAIYRNGTAVPHQR